MEKYVTGSAMARGKVDCQCPQATVAGQSEGGLLGEDFSMQMDAYVGLHVLWAIIEDLIWQKLIGIIV